MAEMNGKPAAKAKGSKAETAANTATAGKPAAKAPDPGGLMVVRDTAAEADSLMELVNWINEARTSLERIEFLRRDVKEVDARMSEWDIRPVEDFSQAASDGLATLHLHIMSLIGRMDKATEAYCEATREVTA